MPQNKATAKLESNGTMTFEPLRPQQGQVQDLTVPHATDTVLPNPDPRVQQPTISPTEALDTLFADPGRVVEGQYKRAPKYSPIKKT
jgi:hypothetical protein